MNVTITIPLDVFSELVASANEGKVLKRLLVEKATHYGALDHGDIQNLVTMFNPLGKGDVE